MHGNNKAYSYPIVKVGENITARIGHNSDLPFSAEEIAGIETDGIEAVKSSNEIRQAASFNVLQVMADRAKVAERGGVREVVVSRWKDRRAVIRNDIKAALAIRITGYLNQEQVGAMRSGRRSLVLGHGFRAGLATVRNNQQPIDAMLCMTLSALCDNKAGCCVAAIATLARLMNCSYSAAARALRRLREQPHYDIVERPGGTFKISVRAIPADAFSHAADFLAATGAVDKWDDTEPVCDGAGDPDDAATPVSSDQGALGRSDQGPSEEPRSEVTRVPATPGSSGQCQPGALWAEVPSHPWQKCPTTLKGVIIEGKGNGRYRPPLLSESDFPVGQESPSRLEAGATPVSVAMPNLARATSELSEADAALVERLRVIYCEAAKEQGFHTCRVVPPEVARILLDQVRQIGGEKSFRLAVDHVHLDKFLAGKVPAARGFYDPFRLTLPRLLDKNRLIDLFNLSSDHAEQATANPAPTDDNEAAAIARLQTESAELAKRTAWRGTQ